MEVNFLVFPAPPNKIKEEELQNLIWIPYYPNLFPETNLFKQRASQSQLTSKDQSNRSTSRFTITKLTPQIKIKEPNDVSQTVYDEDINEESSSNKPATPIGLNQYNSGEQFKFFNRTIIKQLLPSKNNFHCERKEDLPNSVQRQTNPQQQSKISTSTTKFNSQKPIKPADDDSYEPDLSMIQAEELPFSNQQGVRISQINPQASMGKNNTLMRNHIIKKSESQNDIYKNVKMELSLNSYLPTQSNKDKISVTNKPSSKRIPCLYIKPQIPSKYLGLFFHGNGEDLYHSQQLVSFISQSLQVQQINRIKINILAMEYPGYGFYKGQPSEEAILKDASYLFRYLTEHSGIPESNIFVFGRSIGTGVATYLASIFSPGMLVLISPFLSLRSVVSHTHGKFSNLIQDRFKNQEYILNVLCPTFIVHGQKDSIIPVQHSKKLYQLCQGVCQLITPINMTHVRFEFGEDLTEPLKLFMQQNGLRQKVDRMRISQKYFK